MSEKKISGDRGKPAPKWVTIFALCILAATMGTYLIWSRFDDLTVQSSVDHDYKPPDFDLSPASLENYKQKAIAGDAKATAHLYNYYMYQVKDTNASVKVLTMGAERNLADFQMDWPGTLQVQEMPRKLQSGCLGLRIILPALAF